jgi:quinol-cytochrome oxidoreductase complex cytochrome b subunit
LLLNAVRADLDRDLDWARAEAKRQVSHVGLSVILTAVASLAVLGAVIIGLIALYVWLSAQTTQFVALGAIGGGLLLLALILLTLVSLRRRPRRPRHHCS